MMQSGSGAAIAAVFDDRRSADACLAELREHGFHSPWSAVGKGSAADATGALPGSGDATPHHDVASASDGVMGVAVRLFHGDASLRRSLVDHGINDAMALEIDRTLPFGGAVVVVAAGERADLAATILSRGGAQVYGTATGVGTRRTDDGPADTGSSGTGRGDSSGFLSDAAARHDEHFGTSMRPGETEHTSEPRAPLETSPDDTRRNG